MNLKLFAWMTTLLASMAVAAAGQELVTDRPDQTESALTVPPGRWQLEAGWRLGGDEADGVSTEIHEGPGTLVRIGLTPAWELRLGWSGLIHTAGGPYPDGAGDAELGAKVALAAERGAAPAVALLFATSVPLGEDGVSSERFDPSFRLSFAHTLNDTLSLGYNVGMEWTTVPIDIGEVATSWRGIYTVALGIALSDRLGAFVEFYGDADGSTAFHSLDGGLTWLLRDNLQLDLAGGVGLSDAAEDWFVGLGVSLRWPE